MKTYIATITILGILLAGSLQADGNHHTGAFDQEKLGEVNFLVSCAPMAQAQFNQAVAMLHSFWYEEAEKTFRQVTVIDPNCVMGNWGIAMSLYHQLWATPPNALELQKGREALQQVSKRVIKTEREKAYLEAVGFLYQFNEKADYSARKLAYQSAMERIMMQYPDDREAAVFYALALISTASPSDKTFSNQKKAMGLLQKVLEHEPDHPGVTHYIIHSSDYPELAELGLKAARAYTRIAPVVPHALHMPSHIFIRLGHWQDAIQSNLAAYDAVKVHARENALTETWDQQLHYMDYAIYAYLQTGETEKASEILRELQSIKKVQPENVTTAYAYAAIPARYAIERGKWHEAADLNVNPGDFPWQQFGWCEAITHFARGLGAARAGQMAVAQNSLQRLETLRNADRAANKDYTADQIEIQRLAVAAWVAHGKGNTANAVNLMRTSAELEDSTEKDNVTPGAIIPARELLGELLLELKRPSEALKELEASLKRTPNRHNAIFRAAQAARLAGDQLKADHYEQQHQQLMTSNQLR
ncbi:hypothetical protein [Nitrosomonas supralitoralis]|uniref:Tetratricopeptide repeat protein n=1 Tax=Nitrosomonas supralitoralis TaxID=2116706 RepID=A0A2P7NW28_9PROT|nr:hypothetical protein [Nitrosomonas supralitoralis]PSJ17680.1 hypothetical protein C7H79_06615 [Nitrosomonas supralitoralis]